MASRTVHPLSAESTLYLSSQFDPRFGGVRDRRHRAPKPTQGANQDCQPSINPVLRHQTTLDPLKTVKFLKYLFAKC
jgi:hypothetical protein